MENIAIEEKGFVLASVLACHMYFKEHCEDSCAMLETVKQDDAFKNIKTRLLLDKSFADVPDQDDLFNKAVNLLAEICKNKDQGVETQLFSLVKKISRGVSKDIRKSAFSLAKHVALEDDTISVNEQNFLNQIEKLLDIASSEAPQILGKTLEKLFKSIWSIFSFFPIQAKIAILVVVAGVIVFTLFHKNTTSTHVAATFKGYEKIDKLYTSFTVLPLLRKSYSSTDSIVSFWEKTIAERKLPSTGRILDGFVRADYDISIGYDKVSEIIGGYIGKECIESLKTIAEPEILSIKANVYPPEGNAASIQNQMYVTKNNETSIKNALVQEMKNNGQWEPLMERGKSVLNVYISLYCGGGK